MTSAYGLHDGRNKMTTDPIEQATIVYEKPASGEFKEIHFGQGRGNTLWVKFSDNLGIEEWIGTFSCGDTQTMRVTKTVSPDRFMIVAGGYAYLVDATRRELLNQYLEPFVSDITYDPINNHFIAADVRIRIIEDSKQIWSSHRIAIDDIYDMKVEGRILTGTSSISFDELTEDFSFDLDTREFLSGPDFSSWDTPETEKKPWWKFWN